LTGYRLSLRFRCLSLAGEAPLKDSMNNGRDPTGKEEAADPTVIACVVFQTHDPQRHRPDRIILGEIRGGEAYDLLQLLNTGHSGSLSTVHATSARQALSRFASCVLQSGVDLPYRAIKTNIGHSVNAVVQLERRPGRRFVSEAMQISSFDADVDEFDLSTIFAVEKKHA
jgi:Type II/IV secretion system protein